jgi:hypothetical protein
VTTVAVSSLQVEDELTEVGSKENEVAEKNGYIYMVTTGSPPHTVRCSD